MDFKKMPSKKQMGIMLLIFIMAVIAGLSYNAYKAKPIGEIIVVPASEEK